MSLASRWRQWWSQLTGRPAAVAPQERSVARPGRRNGTPSEPTPGPNGLSLAPDRGAPDKTTVAGRKHVGAGGFDPYSSDAGYEKPHGWEQVDRN